MNIQKTLATMGYLAFILLCIWTVVCTVVPASISADCSGPPSFHDLPSPNRPCEFQLAMDTGNPGAADNKAVDSIAAESLTVGDIHLIADKNGREKACFTLSRFYNLRVFSLEGAKPRIVIDIEKVDSWKGKSIIPFGGALINRVRTHFDRGKRALRIVLDLAPSMDYVAEPLYYKAEGIYCIAVSANKLGQ